MRSKKLKDSLLSSVAIFDIKKSALLRGVFWISQSKKINFYVLIVLTLLCFAIFLPFYPGVFDNWDGFNYFKAVSGIEPIYYWHAPFLQYFWRFWGLVGAFFIFNLASYWLGIALTAYALFSSIYARVLFILLLGFFPTNLNFINYILSDSVVFSTLILAMSFVFLYLFRVKKSFFLWLALGCIFIATGLKQDIIIYTSFMLLIVSYLMLKHYVRYQQLPSFSYKKKSHIVIVFLMLLSVVFGSVTYINSKYEANYGVMWKGLFFWDLMATSVYSQKDLFYPVLIKPEFQHKISSSELYNDINREFNPKQNQNVCCATETKKYTKSFSSLNQADKIFILNQFASNPVAYLYHRFLVAKYMLLSSPYSIFGIGTNWAVLNIKSSNNSLINILQNVFMHLMHISLRAIVFYQIIMLLFVWSLLRIAPFNTYHNAIERSIILCLSCASFILFITFFFISPADQLFRYHTSALYTAEISVVLLLRAIYKYCTLQYTWNNFSRMIKQWSKFIFPRLKFLLLLIVSVFLVVTITKHNKNVLRNHFNTILLNNKIEKDKIPSFYKDITVNTVPQHLNGYDIYINQQMIILKKSDCVDLANQNQFFLRVFPQHRLDLYLGRFIYGYDAFLFDSMKNGIVMNDGKTCVTLAYLPQYKINHMVIGQVDSHNQFIWKTNLSDNISHMLAK